jgi:signal transduction histidine kinase
VVFLAATLGLFSLLLYGNFHKYLYDEFDDLLSSQAEGVAALIDSYWRAGNVTGLNGTAASNDKARDATEFVNIARGWVEERRKSPEFMSIFIQILDTKGGRLVASKSSPRLTGLEKEDLEDILDEDETFNTIDGYSAEGKKLRFRICARPLLKDGKAEYIVLAAGPASLVSLALRNLRLILFVLLPLTILLAGIPGLFLVKLTLKPVDRMIDTLRQITAENLKLKIHLPDTKDEVKRLADTFNDMIGRLDRSFSSQQRFIQDVSHELKVPLAILREELTSVLAKPCSQEEYSAVARKALKELDNSSKAIENFIALSRLEDSDILLEIRKVNMTRLIEDVVDEMRAFASQKAITVSSSLQEDVVLDGDEEQLRRLLINLIDNAVKYTLRNGKIAIMLHKEGGNAAIVVSDTGIGMPEDEIPYIFDRFYKIEKTRPDDGFGIGLSIAKSIVSAHKGVVRVESELGKGSTFTVSLPILYTG